MRSSSSLRPAVLVAQVGIGAAVGVLAGLFGIGGGVFLVVGLLALGLSQHGAHATSLAAIVPTAAAAVVPFALAGEVSVAAAAVLAPTAMVGAVVGAAVMRRVSEERLRIAFVAFVVLMALRLFAGTEGASGAQVLGGGHYLALTAVGLLAGLLSAVMGVGGGIIMVPALVLLFGFGQHAAEGTSLAVVIPTALVGAWRHSRSGYTAWSTGALLGVSGIAGGVAGALLALSLDGLLLQRLFAGFVVLVALHLLWRGRRRSAPGPAPPA